MKSKSRMLSIGYVGRVSFDKFIKEVWKIKSDLFEGFIKVITLFAKVMPVIALVFILNIYIDGISNAYAEDLYIAGEAPSQRPANAPTIDSVGDFATWHTKSMNGIIEPIPTSIKEFVDDQGNWFNPMFYPGMLGVYDIRGWHGAN